MTNSEIMELFKKIDVHYNTKYSENKEMVVEWTKYLKKYSAKEVFNSFEYYLKYYPTNPPRMYNLINDLKTLEQKVQEENIKTICPYCRESVTMSEYNHHYGRCLDIEYIEKNVKKYLNQQIIRDDYYKMSDEDLKLRLDKVARMIIKESPDSLEAKYLKKYLYES
jgi:hypothetical protein